MNKKCNNLDFRNKLQLYNNLLELDQSNLYWPNN